MAITLTEFRAQFQEPMRDGLVEIIDNTSKILPLLHFIPVDDLQYAWSRRTALPSVAFRALNADYTPSAGTPERVTADLAIMGGEIRTDNQLVNKRGQQARTREITGMVRSAGLFFDKYFIDGDRAVSTQQFNGLNARATGNQLITAGTNGAQLTLSMVDDLLDRVRGPNSGKVLLISKTMRRKMKQLIVASAGGAAVTDVGGSLLEYDGARLVEVEEDNTNSAILGFDETTGSSALTASIYCARFGSSVDEEDVQGLLGSNFMQVDYQGQRGTAHIDVLDANLGIEVFHPQTFARLKGLLAPA